MLGPIMLLLEVQMADWKGKLFLNSTVLGRCLSLTATIYWSLQKLENFGS